MGTALRNWTLPPCHCLLFLCAIKAGAPRKAVNQRPLLSLPQHAWCPTFPIFQCWSTLPQHRSTRLSTEQPVYFQHVQPCTPCILPRFPRPGLCGTHKRVYRCPQPECHRRPESQPRFRKFAANGPVHPSVFLVLSFMPFFHHRPLMKAILTHYSSRRNRVHRRRHPRNVLRSGRFPSGPALCWWSTVLCHS